MRMVPLTVCAVAGAALSMFVPSVAQASPSPATLTLSSYEFPSRTALPGGLSGTVPLTGGSSVTLTAPEYQYEPATTTAPASYWEFMFWDVDATSVTTETATFTAPATGGAFRGPPGTRKSVWPRPTRCLGRRRLAAEDRPTCRPGHSRSPITKCCPVRR